MTHEKWRKFGKPVTNPFRTELEDPHLFLATPQEIEFLKNRGNVWTLMTEEKHSKNKIIKSGFYGSNVLGYYACSFTISLKDATILLQ